MFKKGFTLIEILFVIVVIGILASIVIPRLLVTATEAKENACNANIANINTQIELWYYNKGSYPANDLSDIAADVNYFPDGIPNCPVTPAESYAMDPATHRVYDAVAGTDHDHTP